MASGLLNPKHPKKSRETISHEPKQPPWKTKAQVRRTTTTTAIEDRRNSDESAGRSFTGEGNGLNGYSVFENRVRIALNCCSKLDMRELRRRLTSELDQVRRLVKKLEASSKNDPGAGIGIGVLGGGTQSQFSSNSVAEKKNKKQNQKKVSSTKAQAKSKAKPFSGQLHKACFNVLEKLMKHKFGWVFNAPVDARALGLLDYHLIVKRPMDLGTVKTCLINGQYESALGFADDVRLTFRNALLYNPKGQDVHSMAQKLLSFFDEKWTAIEADHNLTNDHDHDHDHDHDENEAGLGSEIRPQLERAESVTKPVEPDPQLAGPGLKKPKAKEPDKRDMTYEEKQRLSTSLQNLPSEKLDNVVQIIKKRNLGLCQQEDEIEVDIASVDPETLWELDRFVTNYNKGLTKKRKPELPLQSRPVQKNVAYNGSKTDSDSEGSLASGFRN